MYVNRELIGTHGRAIERAHPRTHTYPQVEESQIGDNRMSTSCWVMRTHHVSASQPVWLHFVAIQSIVTVALISSPSPFYNMLY